MFTWLVTHLTRIISIDIWVVVLERVTDKISTVWQSIAHDWACMTVSDLDEDTYSFFAMEESFAKTNFATKQKWSFMNLEFPVSAGQPLDGHIVSWHIDTIGVVDWVDFGEDGSLRLQLRYSNTYDILVVPKWSICLNGVSLTVVDVMPWGCSVRLIPLTQESTNLGVLWVWDVINIEFDMMAKYATKWWRN